MAQQAKKRGREAATEAETKFGQALDEVEGILAKLEAEEIDVDDLAAEVKRAVQLIALCRRKLTATETEVREYVDALQAEAAEAAGPGGERAAVDPAAAEGDLPF